MSVTQDISSSGEQDPKAEAELEGHSGATGEAFADESYTGGDGEPSTPTMHAASSTSGPSHSNRKRASERRRRAEITTRLRYLERLLAESNVFEMSKSRKWDKERIIHGAAEFIAQQRGWLENLQRDLKTLSRELEELRGEKVELRSDKMLLKDELDKLREENRKLRSDNIHLWQAMRRQDEINVATGTTNISNSALSAIYGSSVPPGTLQDPSPPPSDIAPDYEDHGAVSTELGNSPPSQAVGHDVMNFVLSPPQSMPSRAFRDSGRADDDDGEVQQSTPYPTSSVRGVQHHRQQTRQQMPMPPRYGDWDQSSLR